MPLTSQHRAARRNVEHLAARTAHHERTGDLIAASVFAERLVHALTHLDEHERYVIVGDHAPEPRADTFHRDVFAARLVRELRAETHVAVGDHAPEPRLRTERKSRTNFDQVKTIHAMSPTNQFFDVGDPRRVIKGEQRT